MIGVIMAEVFIPDASFVRVDTITRDGSGREHFTSSIHTVKTAKRKISQLPSEVVSVDISAATYEEYISQYSQSE